VTPVTTVDSPDGHEIFGGRDGVAEPELSLPDYPPAYCHLYRVGVDCLAVSDCSTVSNVVRRHISLSRRDAPPVSVPDPTVTSVAPPGPTRHVGCAQVAQVTDSVM